MAMSLKSRIQDDIKTAMRARERERLGCLRLSTAAIKQKEVDERVELDGVAGRSCAADQRVGCMAPPVLGNDV